MNTNSITPSALVVRADALLVAVNTYCINCYTHLAPEPDCDKEYSALYKALYGEDAAGECDIMNRAPDALIAIAAYRLCKAFLA